jgi:hypothetical protein
MPAMTITARPIIKASSLELNVVDFLSFKVPAIRLTKSAPITSFRGPLSFVFATDQANAHRISRHALSLFNCDWFEEY